MHAKFPNNICRRHTPLKFGTAPTLLDQTHLLLLIRPLLNDSTHRNSLCSVCYCQIISFPTVLQTPLTICSIDVHWNDRSVGLDWKRMIKKWERERERERGGGVVNVLAIEWRVRPVVFESWLVCRHYFSAKLFWETASSGKFKRLLSERTVTRVDWLILKD